MSNEMKDWLEDRKQDAWDCIGEITSIYEDYHNYSEDVYKKIEQVLAKYNFI